MTKKRKIILWCAIVGALVVAVLGAVAYTACNDPFFRRRAFDEQQWRTGDARVRGTMVHDLMDRKLIDGKSRDELVALLGEPDRSYDEPVAYVDSDRSIAYVVDIGDRFCGAPWTYRLWIELDEARNAGDYRLAD